MSGSDPPDAGANEHMNDEFRGGRAAATNGLAVASLVLGILWIFWIGSILALGFGYIGKRQIDRSRGRQQGRGLAIAGITLGWVGVGTLLVVLTLSLLGSFQMPQMPGPMMGGRGAADAFASNGERIYFTASSRSGEAITYEEGPGGGMMAGMLACADCHGPDGRGGRVRMMMQSFQAADIRWETLTGEHGDHDRDGTEEGEHPPYTPETLRTAITQGIASGGQPLDPAMPRWRMSEEDLTDLITFLQTLGEE